MSAPLPPGSTIGIIGGGQLGRMLAMASARLAYRTIVLEPQPDCPAAQVAGRHVMASYDNGDALRELADAADVVTYEFENVPVEAVRLLEADVPVLPPPRALAASQDRLVEKQFLNDSGIATAPFLSVNSGAELADALDKLGGNGVLKTRRLGYDGKGQRILRGPGDPDRIFADMGGVPLILEGLIGFEREISVIAARSAGGAMAAYDPAENIHRDGMLYRSTVPAAVSPPTAEAARAAAFSLLEALDYVGVVGVEFFVLADDGLVANEFAPRVHNSGHWTEGACAISQFEQHIRAVAGLPLGTTGRHSDCIMENLVGEDVLRAVELLNEPGLILHLYGKAEVRPGRKMGHLTRIRPR
jgi:5-(carboxyamino)imidazole ribonucleotide synthase